MEVQTGPVTSEMGRMIQGINMFILLLTVVAIVIAIVFVIRRIKKKRKTKMGENQSH